MEVGIAIATEKMTDDFATDVLNGLSKTKKTLSPKYIYDNKGSELFEKIMKLPEYYLTRCEQEIIDKQSDVFSALIDDRAFNLVELGAGNGEKTKLLLNHFLKEKKHFTYYPIDISKQAIDVVSKTLSTELPEVNFKGMVAEYFEGLKWINKHNSETNLVLFLGSNIGNFDKKETVKFLSELRNSLKMGDYTVIGFDLKKEIQTLINAYDDKQKITKKFNMNLLTRMNNELGADFNLEKFDYYTTYNPKNGAIESFLISLATQEVNFKKLDKIFKFDKFEAIHTEYSFKFTINQIDKLAKESGFEVVTHLFDSKKYFTDSIWRKK